MSAEIKRLQRIEGAIKWVLKRETRDEAQLGLLQLLLKTRRRMAALGYSGR